MPARYSRKVYVKNGYYHLYNRGVEKRRIFEDESDYAIFLHYLKEQLSQPPDPSENKKVFTLQGQAFKGLPRLPKNFYQKIELIAYCLMPNHYHLLVHCLDPDSLYKFMQTLSTRHVMYFNKKYGRIGSLYQGRYKAILITDDNYLLHLSRYIHLNPSEENKNLLKGYSSYPEFLGLRENDWIKTDIILNFFKKPTLPEFKKINGYKSFVEKSKFKSEEILGKLTLEE